MIRNGTTTVRAHEGTRRPQEAGAGWASRVLLPVGSLALLAGVLGGVEAFLRAAPPAALQGTRVYREHVFSGTLGWTPRPNGVGQWPNGKTYSVNGRGYRGRALGPRRPADGSRRVIVLGDSIAFGAGVGDEETFARRLDAVSSVEVANLAVSGFGIDQALLRLESEGFALAPDVVVLNVCLFNDYVDDMLDSYLHDAATPKPRYELRGGDLVLRDAHLERHWLAMAELRLEERTYLFSALALVASPLVHAATTPAAAHEHWVARRQRVLDEFDAAALVTTRLVARLGRRCREEGVDLVVLLHPDRASYSGDDLLASPLERLDAGSAGLRVIDLRRRYWEAGLAFERLAFDEIGHLTPVGHAFVADVLRHEL
jgi:hypothetical protein